MVTNVLLVIAIILFCILYLSFYAKYTNEYDIVQVFLDNVSPDILYEKHPIVIYDSLVNPKDLLNTLFKYQYLFHKEFNVPANNAIAIKSKFSILYSPHNEQSVVKLIHPKYTSEFQWHSSQHQRLSNTDINTTNIQYIDVQLKRNQVILVPPHWIIHTDVTLHKIDIDDVASCLYFRIF
jgi:hypothetical protein